MGTWCGTSRTNYFRVRDGEVFQAWGEKLGFTVVSRVFADRQRQYALATYDCWPSHEFSSEGALVREVDFFAELAAHVSSDEIVVCIQAGAEKLRYVTGEAVAFRVSLGQIEKITLSLDDIYNLAEQKWATRPSLAEN